MSNKVETVNLTPFELKSIISILNAPGTPGGSIRDIRTISGTVKHLKAVLPEDPTPPKAPHEDMSKASPEELKAYETAVEGWGKVMDAHLAVEKPVTLDPVQKTLIRQRLGSFSAYSNAEHMREKIITLADKFGIS